MRKLHSEGRRAGAAGGVLANLAPEHQQPQHVAGGHTIDAVRLDRVAGERPLRLQRADRHLRDVDRQLRHATRCTFSSDANRSGTLTRPCQSAASLDTA
jgi:hypothetical protein